MTTFYECIKFSYKEIQDACKYISAQAAAGFSRHENLVAPINRDILGKGSGAVVFFLTKYDSSGNRVYTRQTGTAGKVRVRRADGADRGGTAGELLEDRGERTRIHTVFALAF